MATATTKTKAGTKAKKTSGKGTTRRKKKGASNGKGVEAGAPFELRNGKAHIHRESVEWGLGVLGLDFEKTETDEALVEVLRTAIDEEMATANGGEVPSKDSDAWLVCEACGEYQDENQAWAERCPFCGDVGEGALIQADARQGETPEPPETTEPPTKPKANKSPAKPKKEGKKVEGKASLVRADAKPDDVLPAPTEKELDRAVKKIANLQKDIVGSGYDLGVELRRVHEAELWKARGYRSFSDFLGKETEISRDNAYSLIAIAETFSREKFLEVGPSKLKLLARLPKEDREDLVDGAKDMTKEQVREAVREKRERNGSTSSKSPGRPRKEDQTVTLIGKVGGKAKAIPFMVERDGERVAVTKYEKGAFGEYQLSEDVVLFIAPRFKGTELVGLQVAFERAED